MPDRNADLERRVAQLEQVVAQLCEQIGEQDDEQDRDLDGNIVPRITSTDPHGGL